VILVDSEDVIAELDALCLKKAKRMYNLYFRHKWILSIGRYLSPEYDKQRVKFEENIKKNTLFCGASNLMILIADQRIKLTELSAQIFLYNIQLYAKTWGIGSRQSNARKYFLSHDSKARKILKIPDKRHIQAILFLGYLSLEYANKVEGRKPQIYFR